MDYFDFDKAADIFGVINEVDQYDRTIDSLGDSRCIESPALYGFDDTSPQHDNREHDITIAEEVSYQTITEYPSIFDQVCTQTQVPGQSTATMVSELDKDRKRCARMPRDAVVVLKKWFADHSGYPYPTQQQHNELQMLTGLRRTQIVNWLANTRRRVKAVQQEKTGASVTGAVDIPRAMNNDWYHMTPMDRWKASPPENEFALVTDIQQAVANQSEPRTPHIAPGASQIQSYASSVISSTQEKDHRSGSDTWSDFAFDTKHSSYSGGSIRSLQSSSSLGSKPLSSSSSYYHIHRRRRRRVAAIQNATTNRHNPSRPRKFQCTFCTESFSSKYDWQRHEKSLHLTLDWWTCSLNDSVTSGENTKPHCAFCSELQPNSAHLEAHNFSVCQDKPSDERTFYRKDHLCQHLKLVHGCLFQDHMNGWRVERDNVKSRCGFCSMWMDTWKQRVDHLANHFKDGLSMGSWVGDRGFSPEIENAVQNSIPAHVIDHERRTMNPYVARSSAITDASPASPAPWFADQPCGATRSDETGLDMGFSEEITSSQSKTTVTVNQDVAPFNLAWGQPDWNLWELTGNALHTYVQTCLSEDPTRIPSDQEMRDYARMLIFGTIDPLDWTAADEAGWLSAFKYHAGIGEKPEQEQFKTMPTVGANTKATESAKGGKIRGIPKTRNYAAMNVTLPASPVARPGTPFQSRMISSAVS